MGRYQVSEVGSDWAQLQVRSVESGVDTADVVPYAKFVGRVWSPDSSGFFYWAYPEHGRAAGDDPTALGAGQLMLHRFSRDDDELIYQPDNPRLLAWPYVFADGWLILIITAGSSRKCLVQARRLYGGTARPVELVVTEPRARFEPVGVKDDVLYLLTDEDAPRGRVVSTDLARAESGGARIWAELIPERDDVLERAGRAGRGFLAVYLRDAQHHVVRFDAAGAEFGELDLGEAGPPKHEVEAVNTCRTDLTVDVLLNEYNSSGIAVVSCFQSDTNRAQCHLQDTTPRGDYWAWEVDMVSTEDSFSCSEQDLPFGACFTSAD